MTTPHPIVAATATQHHRLQAEILRDLRAGQATASALAETLIRPPDKVRAALALLLEQGEITSHPLKDGILTVYRLAPKISK